MVHSERAREIFKRVQEAKIKNSKGVMTFRLGDLTVELESMDIVGGAIQDWFGAWLSLEKIPYLTPQNTQTFPDFVLGEYDYLEIKCFNYSAGPAFDVANYGAYINSLLINPERIDASYLIFAYAMDNKIISIKEIWMKKIWEITGPSRTNILEIQKKRGQPVNIRPKKWYADGIKNFDSKYEFIEALHKSALHFRFPNSHTEEWLKQFKDKYQEKLGKPF